MPCYLLLKQIGPFLVSDALENPYGEDDSKSPFPVQPKIKRSYGQNVTVWIKASGLQVLYWLHIEK